MSAADSIGSMYRECIGVDEAGRGCLAGPVVAAAVLFPNAFSFAELLPKLNDSKKISANIRTELAPLIRKYALFWRIGLAWPNEIDEINILNATFRAMARAAAKMQQKTGLPLVIDGNFPIRPDAWKMVAASPYPEQFAIIGGDSTIPAVSAASVLAKNFRDKLMVSLDARYPEYGFALHKGYGTKKHLEALQKKGPCVLHRLTFKGVQPAVHQASFWDDLQ